MSHSHFHLVFSLCLCYPWAEKVTVTSVPPGFSVRGFTGCQTGSGFRPGPLNLRPYFSLEHDDSDQTDDLLEDAKEIAPSI